MAETTFRLPVAGFEQVSRILQAYLSASKREAGIPVKLDDVAKRAVMSRTAVSGNNAFLASLGLIEGGNNKQLTPLGLKAALTLDHPGTPEASATWSSVIEESPDLERVVDAVRIRKGMTEDALLSHIVLMAGVPKTARFLTGARTIIDTLEFAGVLQESDGTFTASLPATPEGETVEVPSRPSASGRVESEPTRVATVARSAGSVAINVHVWVSAKDMDLEELADGLKEFVSRLSET